MYKYIIKILFLVLFANCLKADDLVAISFTIDNYNKLSTKLLSLKDGLEIKNIQIQPSINGKIITNSKQCNKDSDIKLVPNRFLIFYGKTFNYKNFVSSECDLEKFQYPVWNDDYNYCFVRLTQQIFTDIGSYEKYWGEKISLMSMEEIENINKEKLPNYKIEVFDGKEIDKENIEEKLGKILDFKDVPIKDYVFKMPSFKMDYLNIKILTDSPAGSLFSIFSCKNSEDGKYKIAIDTNKGKQEFIYDPTLIGTKNYDIVCKQSTGCVYMQK